MKNDKTKSTQVGLRLDNDQIQEIERLAKFEGIDKMSWIRRAIEDYIDYCIEEEADFMIDEYIQRRISDEELLNYFRDWKGKIPKDIQKDREEYGKRRFTRYEDDKINKENK